MIKIIIIDNDNEKKQSKSSKLNTIVIFFNNSKTFLILNIFLMSITTNITLAIKKWAGFNNKQDT